jgi:hypothetical protein
LGKFFLAQVTARGTEAVYGFLFGAVAKLFGFGFPKFLSDYCLFCHNPMGFMSVGLQKV